jgi:hypothetical protein
MNCASYGTGNDNFVSWLSHGSILLLGFVGDERCQTIVSPVLALADIVTLKDFPTSSINAGYG